MYGKIFPVTWVLAIGDKPIEHTYYFSKFILIYLFCTIETLYLLLVNSKYQNTNTKKTDYN